jgi:hypothetical protein
VKDTTGDVQGECPAEYLGFELVKRHAEGSTKGRIDPDVDEARDYIVEDLMHVGRLDMEGYVDGVGPCDGATPRRNLTGDPYYTDGKRAVVFVSESRTTPKYFALA